MATRGPYLPLQVFWTGERGWGVRCETDIPVGAFVCNYIGHLCTSAEAEEIGHANDKYLFELEHFSVVHAQVSAGEELLPVCTLVPSCMPTPSLLRALLVPTAQIAGKGECAGKLPL